MWRVHGNRFVTYVWTDAPDLKEDRRRLLMSACSREGRQHDGIAKDPSR
jgi:hypothetical protein